VVAVGSAEKALEMLRNGSRFDAVVSDVMMPEMSGPDLYARCFVHSPEVARRFILASGEPAAARELLASAMKRVGSSHAPLLLEKPMSRDTLVAAVLTTAASAEPRSGTYSTTACENDEDQVKKYRG
jgi:CheY-like chemotaxis protein